MVARVEFPREENRGRLQDLVGLTQLGVLLLQPLDLRQFVTGRAGPLPASAWACSTHLRNVSERKYSEVLWQGRWCLLLQSVIVICVARKVTALAVGVGLLELGEPKCVRELVELCR